MLWPAAATACCPSVLLSSAGSPLRTRMLSSFLCPCASAGSAGSRTCASVLLVHLSLHPSSS
eukprot:16449459-Heterocapsa_arctica.AAC.1